MLAEVLIQLEHRRLCSHPISGGEQRARSLSVSYLLDRYVDFTQGIQITHNVGGYGLRYLLPVNLLGVLCIERASQEVEGLGYSPLTQKR